MSIELFAGEFGLDVCVYMCRSERRWRKRYIYIYTLGRDIYLILGCRVVFAPERLCESMGSVGN